MARRRNPASARLRLLPVLIAVLVIVAAAWYWHRRGETAHVAQNHHLDVTDIAASQIDAAKEGRPVRLNGKLEIAKPPRDAQLGVAAPAALLWRHVEMYQWQETCAKDGCHYEKGWSGATIDSHKFREPAGHENPAPPFADAKFAAGSVKLGGLAIDPDVLAQLATTDFPVRAADLPPNLAATFRVQDGVLYAGADPAHPTVGALRVSYRAAGTGDVELTGVQRGTKLAAR
ncbi:MAG TPA: TMEM43 family protein [Rudaea sp.]